MASNKIAITAENITDGELRALRDQGNYAKVALTDLLHHRRLKQMELALEHDAIACECLRQHIKQLDQDISKAVQVEADAVTGGQFSEYRETIIKPIMDDYEETTQVIPVISMAELVYGGNS